MSHFHGSVKGNRGAATRGGSKNSGYKSYAASWDGAIEVRLDHDPATKKDNYVIWQVPHNGKGIDKWIASGIIGDKQFLSDKQVYDSGYRDGLKHAMNSIEDALTSESI